jgi:hypothetical protein
MTIRVLPGRPDASWWTLVSNRLISYPEKVGESGRPLQFLLRIFAVPARDRVSLYRSQARPSNRMSTFRWGCFQSFLRWSGNARSAIDREAVGASRSGEHHHASDRV